MAAERPSARHLNFRSKLEADHPSLKLRFSLPHNAKEGGPCGPPSSFCTNASMDQKRWVYFMYRKRPMSKPP